jgi:hypothetical protein
MGLTPFMLFCTEHQDDVAGCETPRESMKKLGDMWTKLPGVTKARYEAMSKAQEEYFDPNFTVEPLDLCLIWIGTAVFGQAGSQFPAALNAVGMARAIAGQLAALVGGVHNAMQTTFSTITPMQTLAVGTAMLAVAADPIFVGAGGPLFQVVRDQMTQHVTGGVPNNVFA